jgi:hypothetical protein
MHLRKVCYLKHPVCMLQFTFQENRQGDFESCADILTIGRTPESVKIDPIKPYRNVDIFREKRLKVFQKKFGNQ